MISMRPQRPRLAREVAAVCAVLFTVCLVGNNRVTLNQQHLKPHIMLRSASSALASDDELTAPSLGRKLQGMSLEHWMFPKKKEEKKEEEPVEVPIEVPVVPAAAANLTSFLVQNAQLIPPPPVEAPTVSAVLAALNNMAVTPTQHSLEAWGIKPTASPGSAGSAGSAGSPGAPGAPAAAVPTMNSVAKALSGMSLTSAPTPNVLTGFNFPQNNEVTLVQAGMQPGMQAPALPQVSAVASALAAQMAEINAAGGAVGAQQQPDQLTDDSADAMSQAPGPSIQREEDQEKEEKKGWFSWMG